eukprot:scaffold34903_cov37-Cyclotella_meneghiniana.AAC.1
MSSPLSENDEATQSQKDRRSLETATTASLSDGDDSSDSSESEGADAPPPTKRGPGRPKKVDGTKKNPSTSRTGGKPRKGKKFNLFQKPMQYVPPQVPQMAASPSDEHFMYCIEFPSKTSKGDIIDSINGQLEEAREFTEKLYCASSYFHETLVSVVAEASEHIKERDDYIHGLSNMFDEEKNKHNELKVKHAEKMSVLQNSNTDKTTQKELIKLLKSNSRLSDQLDFQREKSRIGVEAQKKKKKKKKENELGLKRAEKQRESAVRTERVQQLATSMHGGRVSGSWTDAIMLILHLLQPFIILIMTHSKGWDAVNCLNQSAPTQSGFEK